MGFAGAVLGAVAVSSVGEDLEGGDEVVFGIDGGLDVLTSNGFAAFAQLAGVGAR